jgi:oligopeptide/dipeptide ABC transporter ATP-binding protein
VKNQALVEIDNLTVHFKTIDGIARVLKEVSLKVGEGELVGLVGESGCGKSVTTKALLGTLSVPPAIIEDGRINFLGKELLGLPKAERAIVQQSIGYIPQDPMTSLNPVFTVGEIMVDSVIWQMSDMRLGRYLYKRRIRTVKKTAKERAVEFLDKMHIPDPRSILGKYPSELSGGMRQRVLIAIALLSDPAMIIADEPTTALDVTIQKMILRLLSEKIEEENLSGLYITHDLGVARSVCHRTYVMYAGTIVEAAETPLLLDEPLHPYTKGLIRSIPKLSEDSFEGIPGGLPDYYNPSQGCRFSPRCIRKTDACEHEKPRLSEVTTGRFVACKLYE